MDGCAVKVGASAPLGASVYPDGVNFSVFSKNATQIELLLFDDEHAAQPSKIIPLNASGHRTYHYWHVFVPRLKAGQVNVYRVHGPFAPENGFRFDGEKILLDPYGLAVAVPESYDRNAAGRSGDNSAVAMKSVVADPGRYDWEGDTPLNRPFAETVIYELHVRGFTRHASSGVASGKRGTYAGLVEKIPYLKDLGVTAVELLAVFQFDPQDASKGRVNYWGYQPISFFAPHHAYSSRQEPLGVLDEFRDMVKALNEFRQRRDVLAEGGKLSLNQLLQRAKIEWHGVALNRPDWSEHSHSLAFTLQSLRGRFLLHGMLNAFWEPLIFELPPVPADGQQRWRRCIDTAVASPDDISPRQKAPFVEQEHYLVPRPLVLLAQALPAAGEGASQAR